MNNVTEKTNNVNCLLKNENIELYFEVKYGEYDQSMSFTEYGGGYSTMITSHPYCEHRAELIEIFWDFMLAQKIYDAEEKQTLDTDVPGFTIEILSKEF